VERRRAPLSELIQQPALGGLPVSVSHTRSPTDYLSAKLEYLHFDLGNANYLVAGIVPFPPPGHPLSWSTNVGVAGDIVRVGLNWKLYP